MVPKLPLSMLEFIRDTIYSNELTTSQMAEAVECSKHSITNIWSNLRLSSVRAPPLVLAGSNLYLDKMVVFLCDKFQVHITTCSISRALASIRWSKKAAIRW
jgi:hypothetical protein